MSWKSRGVVFLVNLDDMEGGLTPWSFVCLFVCFLGNGETWE